MTSHRSFTELQWTPALTRLVRASLAEDLGSGDVTTKATVPVGMKGWGRLIAKAPGVLCGAPVADCVMKLAGRSIKLDWRARDGEAVVPGQEICLLKGPMAALLVGERTALNFLQRLSGIATLTAKFHEAVGGAGGPVICDTRKTTPLWRVLERYAVRAGGGVNLRFGLFDMILIKENHARAAGGLGEAIALAKKAAGRSKMRIAAEARSAEEVAICCEARPDLILLDNFHAAKAKSVIARFRAAGIPFELTGGVNLKNAAAFARTGCDRISIGALTHSAPALDISLQLYREGQSAD